MSRIEGVRMKDEMTREDQSAYMEELYTRRKRRRKRNRFAAFMVMLLCLIVLVLVTCLIGAVCMRYAKSTANGEEVMSSAVNGNEQEPEVMPDSVTSNGVTAEGAVNVEELVAQARAQAAEEAQAEILQGIRSSLIDGETYVEALRPFYKDELLVVSNGRFHFVPILDNLKKNNLVQENLNILESGEYQYLENGQVISHKGIDVSKHQGEIDWQQVAEDGVEFAFIRVVLRGYGTGKLVPDERFEENIEGAQGAGIKVGVYIYTQAINEAELLEEANLVLEMIAPYKLECPVVYDVEKVSGSNGRMNSLSVEERTKLTLLFCQTIENAGYKPMIYHNLEMAALMVDLEQLEAYDKWFAYYNPEMYYPYEYKIWQYSHTGSVKGIEGDVDMNISFSPFWEE